MSAAAAKPVYRVKAGDQVGASARPVADAAMPRTSYSAGDLGHPTLGGWAPPSRSADVDWLRDRHVSVGRLRDLERNEGWVSAGIDRQVDMLVGGMLRLNSRPDAIGLGIETDQAHELGRQIQSKFRIWAEDPTFRSDAERTMPFAGSAALAAREFVGIGESLTILRWIDRPGWPYRTALQQIDPDRLSNPNGRPDDERLRGGVEKDGNNAPIAYHIRRTHPSDLGVSTHAFTWDRVPRWDLVGGQWERPKVLHLFDKRRPGQSRGIGRLVTSMTKVRGLSRYSESEIRTAAINATIVGSLYTQLGAEYAAEAVGNDASGTDWSTFNTARGNFYADRGVLDDARLLTLFPSDRLDLNTTPRQTAGYPAFQTAFLRAIASSLGITYEQLSMDWSQTNYSSARAALTEVWRGVMRLRSILIWGFAQPVFAAWLEEALDLGEIEVPTGAVDFYDAPAAWLRSTWIGPGKGYIDPVKEAQASGLRIDGMISTLQDENAEQGSDWEETLDQLDREAEEIERRPRLGRRPTDTSIVPRTDADDRRANDK